MTWVKENYIDQNWCDIYIKIIVDQNNKCGKCRFLLLYI